MTDHKHITGGVEEDRPVLAAHLRRDHGVDPKTLDDPAEWHREAHREADR